MTVQTRFISWQTSPKQPDPKKCAPICIAYWNYLSKRWGGMNLGCYARRPVVGGTAISSHGSGAALDWRYQSPGPGRGPLLREILPFLINNSEELGIEAIHDYAGKRIWRPPGTSGRPSQPSPECGWRPSSGGQMHPSNTWIHIECYPVRWGDTRSVEEMLAATPPTPTPQPPTPVPPYTIPEGDEMITGLWKGPNDPGVYAVCSNRTKVWCYPNTVDEHQALLRLEGKSDAINTQTSADMFRAFGPVVGPRPAGVDEYGWK